MDQVKIGIHLGEANPSKKTFLTNSKVLDQKRSRTLVMYNQFILSGIYT